MILDEIVRPAIVEWKPPIKAVIEEEGVPIVHHFKEISWVPARYFDFRLQKKTKNTDHFRKCCYSKSLLVIFLKFSGYLLNIMNEIQ